MSYPVRREDERRLQDLEFAHVSRVRRPNLRTRPATHSLASRPLTPHSRPPTATPLLLSLTTRLPCHGSCTMRSSDGHSAGPLLRVTAVVAPSVGALCGCRVRWLENLSLAAVLATAMGPSPHQVSPQFSWWTLAYSLPVFSQRKCLVGRLPLVFQSRKQLGGSRHSRSSSPASLVSAPRLW